MKKATRPMILLPQIRIFGVQECGIDVLEDEEKPIYPTPNWP
jgi:hypothetical protein